MKPVFRHITMRRFDDEFAHHQSIGAELEICLFGDELDDWRQNGVFDRLRRLKESYDPRLTFHGPVYGFDPASRDRGVRDLAYRRVMRTFEAAEMARPELIVFHSSFNRYVYGFDPAYWIDATVSFWVRALAGVPSPTLRIAIENIYDLSPEPLAKVIAGIGGDQVGTCFDVGHFNMFIRDRTAAQWLDHFGPKLHHLHLHDNHGVEDLHLPCGRGSIDYRPLLEWLRTAPGPFSVTVEGKSAPDNDAAVAWVRANVPGYASR